MNNTITGTQVSDRWLTRISTSTRTGSALLLLLIVIVIGFLIYFLMSSAIFKPEILGEKPKAEVKTDTEEEFITAIKSIIEKGGDINAEQDRYNKRTLLHLAANKGYAKAVKLLIDNHANINAREVMELTPLHLAVIEDKIEIVRLLINNGADINSMSKYLSTPLSNAVRHGKVEIAKLLLENGADVNAKPNPGNTPLQSALISLKYDIVQENNTTPDKQKKIIEMLRAYGGKE